MRKLSEQTNSQTNPSIQVWVRNEFSGLDLGDSRLNDRFLKIVSDFSLQPTGSIPKASGSWAATKGAYRFFDNDKANPLSMLEPHFRSTIQRAESQKVVLALQDSTKLNFSHHPETQGLGPIANNSDKTVGFWLHPTLVVTPEGTALGLANAEYWVRDPKEFRVKCRKRNKQDFKEKESYRWFKGYQQTQDMAEQCPRSLVVCVCDREGDIYDVLAQAVRPEDQQPRAHCLIRARVNRAVDCDEAGKLWELLDKQEIAGTHRIWVRGRDGVPKREVKLSIKYTQVKLPAPGLKKHLPAIKIWVIEAREIDPPNAETALCWRLLSSLPITDVASAVEKVEWYGQRWQIEVYFKTVKSGCKLLERQLEHRQRLERVMAVDLIVAWRILFMTKASRETPDLPAETILEENESQALRAYLNERDNLKIKKLGLRQAVRAIAQLGGFLGRKGDGDPGPITIWRGLLRLHDITKCWELFNQSSRKK